jgi:hypothetical protein
MIRSHWTLILFAFTFSFISEGAQADVIRNPVLSDGLEEPLIQAGCLRKTLSAQTPLEKILLFVGPDFPPQVSADHSVTEYLFRTKEKQFYRLRFKTMSGEAWRWYQSSTGRIGVYSTTLDPTAEVWDRNATQLLYKIELRDCAAYLGSRLD